MIPENVKELLEYHIRPYPAPCTGNKILRKIIVQTSFGKSVSFAQVA